MRRVDDAGYTEEDKLVFDMFAVKGQVFRQFSVGKGERTQSTLCHIVERFCNLFAIFLIEWNHFIVFKQICRVLQNHFRRTFDIGDTFTVLFRDDCHTFAFGVERKFADDMGVVIF